MEHTPHPSIFLGCNDQELHFLAADITILGNSFNETCCHNAAADAFSGNIRPLIF